VEYLLVCGLLFFAVLSYLAVEIIGYILAKQSYKRIDTYQLIKALKNAEEKTGSEENSEE